MMLKRETLAALCRRPTSAAKAKIWNGYVGALTSIEGALLLKRFGVTTKLRLAHLLAQWAHESGGFTLIWESGDYSASRIVQVFGVGRHSAAVTASEAKSLAGNGPALFDRVYGLGNPRKAKELGNKKVGDGWRYRGCGIVQLTGRAAHERYAKEIGCSVSELEDPLNSIHGALLEWKEKGCNSAADRDDVERVTKLVNGGRNGLNDRREYLAKAKRLLEDAPFKIPAADPEKKTVRETIKKSPSLRLQFNALISGAVALLMSFWDWLANWGAWFLSLLPGAADEVGSAVGSTQTIAEHIRPGVPLSAKLLVGVAAVCLVTVFFRQLDQKRKAA